MSAITLFTIAIYAIVGFFNVIGLFLYSLLLALWSSASQIGLFFFRNPRRILLFITLVGVFSIGVAFVEFQPEIQSSFDIVYECSVEKAAELMGSIGFWLLRTPYEFIVPRINDGVEYIREGIVVLIEDLQDIMNPIDSFQGILDLFVAVSDFLFYFLGGVVNIDSLNLGEFTRIVDAVFGDLFGCMLVSFRDFMVAGMRETILARDCTFADIDPDALCTFRNGEIAIVFDDPGSLISNITIFFEQTSKVNSTLNVTELVPCHEFECQFIDCFFNFAITVIPLDRDDSFHRSVINLLVDISNSVCCILVNLYKPPFRIVWGIFQGIIDVGNFDCVPGVEVLFVDWWARWLLCWADLLDIISGGEFTSFVDMVLTFIFTLVGEIVESVDKLAICYNDPAFVECVEEYPNGGSPEATGDCEFSGGFAPSQALFSCIQTSNDECVLANCTTMFGCNIPIFERLSGLQNLWDIIPPTLQFSVDVTTCAIIGVDDCASETVDTNEACAVDGNEFGQTAPILNEMLNEELDCAMAFGFCVQQEVPPMSWMGSVIARPIQIFAIILGFLNGAVESVENGVESINLRLACLFTSECGREALVEGPFVDFDLEVTQGGTFFEIEANLDFDFDFDVFVFSFEFDNPFNLECNIFDLLQCQTGCISNPDSCLAINSGKLPIKNRKFYKSDNETNINDYVTNYLIDFVNETLNSEENSGSNIIDILSTSGTLTHARLNMNRELIYNILHHIWDEFLYDKGLDEQSTCGQILYSNPPMFQKTHRFFAEVSLYRTCFSLFGLSNDFAQTFPEIFDLNSFTNLLNIPYALRDALNVLYNDTIMDDLVINKTFSFNPEGNTVHKYAKNRFLKKNQEKENELFGFNSKDRNIYKPEYINASKDFENNFLLKPLRYIGAFPKVYVKPFIRFILNNTNFKEFFREKIDSIFNTNYYQIFIEFKDHYLQTKNQGQENLNNYGDFDKNDYNNSLITINGNQLSVSEKITRQIKTEQEINEELENLYISYSNLFLYEYMKNNKDPNIDSNNYFINKLNRHPLHRKSKFFKPGFHHKLFLDDFEGKTRKELEIEYLIDTDEMRKKTIEDKIQGAPLVSIDDYYDEKSGFFFTKEKLVRKHKKLENILTSASNKYNQTLGYYEKLPKIQKSISNIVDRHHIKYWPSVRKLYFFMYQLNILSTDEEKIGNIEKFYSGEKQFLIDEGFVSNEEYERIITEKESNSNFYKSSGIIKLANDTLYNNNGRSKKTYGPFLFPDIKNSTLDWMQTASNFIQKLHIHKQEERLIQKQEKQLLENQNRGKKIVSSSFDADRVLIYEPLDWFLKNILRLGSLFQDFFDIIVDAWDSTLTDLDVFFTETFPDALLDLVRCKIPDNFDGTTPYNPFCFPFQPETFFVFFELVPSDTFPLQIPWSDELIIQPDECVNKTYNGNNFLFDGLLNCFSEIDMGEVTLQCGEFGFSDNCIEPIALDKDLFPLCPECDYCKREYLQCKDEGIGDILDAILYFFAIIPRASETLINGGMAITTFSILISAGLFFLNIGILLNITIRFPELFSLPFGILTFPLFLIGSFAAVFWLGFLLTWSLFTIFGEIVPWATVMSIAYTLILPRLGIRGFISPINFFIFTFIGISSIGIWVDIPNITEKFDIIGTLLDIFIFLRDTVPFKLWDETWGSVVLRLEEFNFGSGPIPTINTFCFFWTLIKNLPLGIIMGVTYYYLGSFAITILIITATFILNLLEYFYQLYVLVRNYRTRVRVSNLENYTVNNDKFVKNMVSKLQEFKSEVSQKFAFLKSFAAKSKLDKLYGGSSVSINIDDEFLTPHPPNTPYPFTNNNNNEISIVPPEEITFDDTEEKLAAIYNTTTRSRESKKKKKLKKKKKPEDDDDFFSKMQ